MSKQNNFAEYSLNSWYREGLAEGIATVNPDDTHAEVNVKVDTKQHYKDESESTEIFRKTMPLVGPGEISSINTNQIVRTWPSKETMDFPKEFIPFIEFHDEDFLWRYTPQVSKVGDQLTPWLTLLCLQESGNSEFTQTIEKGVQVIKIDNASSLPDLSEAWKMAHVHIDELPEGVKPKEFLKSNPFKGQCRLLSNHDLNNFEGETFRCFLVPTFERGRITGIGRSGFEDELETIPGSRFAWNNTSENIELPVYYSWRFTVAKEGNFLTLATKLAENSHSTDIESSYPVESVDRCFSQNSTFKLGAALAPIDKLPNVQDDRNSHKYLKDLLDTVNDNTGDPVVLPPGYGIYHAQAPDKPDWFKEINYNRSYRATAGIGTTAVQQHQEELMEASWKKVGEINKANEQLQNARFSSAVIDSINKKRFSNISKEMAINLTSDIDELDMKRSIEKSSIPNAAVTTQFRKVLSRIEPTIDQSTFFKDIFETGCKAIDEKLVQGADKDELTPAFNVKLMSMLTSAPYLFLWSINSCSSVHGWVKKINKTLPLNENFSIEGYCSRHSLRVTIRKDRGRVVEELNLTALNLLKNEYPNQYNILKDKIERNIGLKYIKVDNDLNNPIVYTHRNISVYMSKDKTKEELWWKFYNAHWYGILRAKSPSYPKSITKLKDLFDRLKNSELNPFSEKFNLKDLLLQHRFEYSSVASGGGGARAYKDIQAWNALSGDDRNLIVEHIKKSFVLLFNNPDKNLTKLETIFKTNVLFMLGNSIELEKGDVKRTVRFNNNYYAYLVRRLAFENLITVKAPEILKKDKVGSLYTKCLDGISRFWAAIDGIATYKANDKEFIIFGVKDDFYKDHFFSGNISYIYEESMIVTSMDKLNKLELSELVNRPKKLASLANVFSYGADLKKFLSSDWTPLYFIPQLPYTLQFMQIQTSAKESIEKDVKASVNVKSVKRKIMAHPEFNIPAMEYLVEQNPDYLLPGINDLKENSVLLLETNNKFIESYLVGLNHEMSRELLWREFPTDMRGSYFRTFWSHTGIQESNESMDIRPLDEWTSKLEEGISTTIYKRLRREQCYRAEEIKALYRAGYYREAKKLGQVFRHLHIALSEIRGKKRSQIEKPSKNNKPNEAIIKRHQKLVSNENKSKLGEHGVNIGAGKTVLFFKSRLFDKYPNTLLFAVKSYNSSNSEEIKSNNNKYFPTFSGSLPGGISWFGFDISADSVENKNEKWAFVLQECPGEFNFKYKDISSETSSAKVAESLLNRPVMFVIKAEDLLATQGGN